VYCNLNGHYTPSAWRLIEGLFSRSLSVELALIAGRKTQLGKQHSESAPQQDRCYPSDPPIPHRKSLKDGKNAVHYGS